MSYMRGDLLTKTRKLVKGLAMATPRWLKAMEDAPPVVFPRTDGNMKKIVLPEDVYIKKFFKKHPDSLYHDAVKVSGFDPPPARVFAWRVLELKQQGVDEVEAMAVADMEYVAEKKAKRKAYRELKQIARLQGKEPPPNPYPSAIKEIQAEEAKYVKDRFSNPKILEIVRKMKEERVAEMQDQQRGGGGGWPGGRPGGQASGWRAGGSDIPYQQRVSGGGWRGGRASVERSFTEMQGRQSGGGGAWPGSHPGGQPGGWSGNQTTGGV